MLEKIIFRIAKLTSLTYQIYLICKMLQPGGFLFETGWKMSVKKRMPVDKLGKQIPWLTYSFLDFLFERVRQDMSVFEWGSGNSTIFFAKNVSSVTSVEHDKNFYDYINQKLPDNVNYLFRALEGESYEDAIKEFDKKYDIIIIDGRKRVKCALNSVQYLTDKGIIIWDNSLREKYRGGFEYLEKQGFRHINFKGLNPVSMYESATTVFYRDNNIFSI